MIVIWITLLFALGMFAGFLTTMFIIINPEINKAWRDEMRKRRIERQSKDRRKERGFD